MDAQRIKTFLAETDLTDLAAVARFILQHKPDDGPVWVFAYGSLIWNPEMAVAEDLAAALPGYRREMCIEAVVHRGTPEQPGLVLGIRQALGEVCQGHAFRLDATQLMPSLHRLIERELVTDCYLPLWLPIDLADGRSVAALTMVVNEAHAQFVQPSLDEKLRMIRHARGGRGSSREYLVNIARHLRDNAIEDAEIDALIHRLDAPER
ncbi:gamma-glutamylcyclotransferase [Saccharospirillum mangrovi]|uniref:gamma-glutamylcyclotransferase n=1 Tax=Saccharospirillum mangrovi TaxID=2161747 RepID=UPI000D3CD10E|nr:gamma-glutamylcyclotransferase [Saccharospirillum mangrovi]